jgi:hypothetical protein
MPHWIKTTSLAAAVSALALVATAPQADAQRWRHHHRGGSVAAGVAAGIVGGAIVGSLAARPYGYGYRTYEPGYAYGAPYGYTYGYAPDYEYGPGYYAPHRRFGYVRPGRTGLRSGTVRVSPHYDY